MQDDDDQDPEQGPDVDYDDHGMTSDRYRELLEILGLSLGAAGRFLGVAERNSRRWATGVHAPPQYVALLFELMAVIGAKPDDVTALISAEEETETETDDG